MQTEQEKPVREFIERVACHIGLHDLELIEVEAMFGSGVQIEKYQCKNCEIVVSRVLDVL